MEPTSPNDPPTLLFVAAMAAAYAVLLMLHVRALKKHMSWAPHRTFVLVFSALQDKASIENRLAKFSHERLDETQLALFQRASNRFFLHIGVAWLAIFLLFSLAFK